MYILYTFRHMDRAWMDALRTSEEYQKGVEEFIEFATRNGKRLIQFFQSLLVILKTSVSAFVQMDSTHLGVSLANIVLGQFCLSFTTFHLGCARNGNIL